MSRAWKVLGRLAESKVEECRQELQQVNSAISQLESRKSQIVLLIAENQARLSAKKKGCSMSEIQVITRFITNLGMALRGTEVEIDTFDKKRASIASQLAEAKREGQKMESLLERDEARRKKARELREQKVMDAAAITLFNQK
jgi:flagellar export protein FliJ